jgi:hypothetical protein
MVNNTWDGVSAYAESVGAKFGELVAAQWALESGYGKHVSGEFNYFGLKGGGTNCVTKEFIDGQWVTLKDRFIDFPSLAACIEYLVKIWYKDYRVYKGINNCSTIEDAAYALSSEGYATDPDYPQKLICLITEYSSVRNPIRLTNAAKYYKEDSHQVAAWNYLEERLTPEELSEFALLYRAGPAKPAFSHSKNPLTVPYFSQRDNQSGQGFRECFSSSCAMLAAFHGAITSDDDYNLFRRRYGDTTDSNAQVETLQSLDLKPLFCTAVTVRAITDEIDQGRPVAVGWLHYGPYHEPVGGGHWSVIIGYTETDFIHHDPYGEADIVNGSYLNATGGKAVRYSKRCWIPRWRVGGSNGWAMFVSQ